LQGEIQTFQSIALAIRRANAFEKTTDQSRRMLRCWHIFVSFFAYFKGGQLLGHGEGAGSPLAPGGAVQARQAMAQGGQGQEFT
jgi:hypothetical protein